MNILKIHWGDENTRSQIRPMDYSFLTEPEMNAFIDGVEFAIDCFPKDADASEEDLSNYSENEERAFCLGLEAADGFVDYKIIE